MATTKRTRITQAVAAFDPIPSYGPGAAIAIEVATAVPEDATVLGLPAFSDGAVPDRVPLDRATLDASGFAAARGQTLILPRADGPTIIEAGMGPRASIDMAAIRDAAAAFAMAAVRHERLVVDLTGLDVVDPGTAGQAIVEGVLLARYRYRVFRDIPVEAHLRALTIVVERARVRAVRSGATRGEII